MSTGLECEYYEGEDGLWYYVLQDGDCPVQCWNWREYATAYGPFRSYAEGSDHLRAHHANPGGHSIFKRGAYRQTVLLEKLFKSAEKRR